jgi:hypothetical protein
MHTFIKRSIAVALTGAMSSTLLVTAASAATAPSDRVTLHALAVSEGPDGSEGSSNTFTIEYGKAAGSDFRVGFSQDEVGGTGDQWESAGWNAAAVATLLNGAPLSAVRVDYDVNGRIDGPSAGALMTVGLLSLMRGDKIKPGITMTGTVNPDGTIGPVGGIPYKVDGAKQAKAKTMLIPLGQRNSKDDSGELVDVVEIGRRKDVTVKEVGDVYQAYKAFTGKTLPRPGATGSVRLSNQDYAQIKARVKARLADFDASAGEFNSLATTTQVPMMPYAQQANALQQQAKKLTDEGLQAGAYTQALEAAALASATVKIGRAYEVLLTQGIPEFVQQIQASAAISGRVEALFDELKAYRPKTVSDASTLIAGYSNAIDVLSVAGYADNLIEAAGNTNDFQTALDLAVAGAVYYELAGTVVDGTKDIFEVGKGGGGTALSKNLKVAPVADFFRKAAEANLSAFDALILAPAAEQEGVSQEAVKTGFANNDFDYALAQSSENVLNGALDNYLGDAKTSNYAKVGGAVEQYARTAGLLTKYYSLGEVGEGLEVTGISNDQALSSALDLGRTQVQRGVSVLKAKKVSPTLVVGSYEIAGVEREGDASDKLDALDSYLSAFVGSRVLAYLGGFQAAGLGGR